MSVVMNPPRLQRLSAYFRRAVDDGRLPGYAVRINDGADCILSDEYGARDREHELPIERDTVFRIFSMTKPLTSVTALILCERGDLDLRTPVRDLIPEFADTPVCAGPEADPADTVAQRTQLTVWHLLTHTSGLTYPFMGENQVNPLYSARQIAGPYGPADLAASCRSLATIPLLFQPGSAWNYSVSTDVLGRVIEVAAGSDLATVFDAELLAPLGMGDTGFTVPAADRERVATLYLSDAENTSFMPSGMPAGDPPTLLSGGAGLYSTIEDYQKFVLMLSSGGRVGDDRLIGAETLRYMTRNHLPGGRDLAALQRHPMEDDLAGLGFGLGFAVVVDAPARHILTRDGAFYWNGAGGSTFVVDPTTGLSATFMMQVRAPTNFRWEARLHQLMYGALG